MCRDCKNWQPSLGYMHFGVRFAPCALKPDTRVKDTRDVNGEVEQAYRMSETYKCNSFSKL